MVIKLLRAGILSAVEKGREWFRRVGKAKSFWQHEFKSKLTRSFTSRSPIRATSNSNTRSRIRTRASPSIKSWQRLTDRH